MSPGESARLIIVDDEPDIRGMVAEYFCKDGYEVSGCASGAELDAVLASGVADLVVLDVSLPGEDGISIARRLRAAGRMPIIMLTAMHDIVDRVVGLEVGADDYVTKPFDLRELRARVRAVLRRAAPDADAPAAADMSASARHESDQRFPCFGRVLLDTDSRCLVDCQGVRTRLTAMEFDLLVTFARNPNRVLSRDLLLDASPVHEAEAFDRSIDIRVTRIRKKIEVDPATPQVIRTVRSAGYIYVPPRAA